MTKGRLSYFKGERCRCREIKELQFNEKKYLSNLENVWLEDFGDFREKKVYRLNVLLGEQNDKSYKLYKSVNIKIPKWARQVDQNLILDTKKSNLSRTLVITTRIFLSSLRIILLPSKIRSAYSSLKLCQKMRLKKILSLSLRTTTLSKI